MLAGSPLRGRLVAIDTSGMPSREEFHHSCPIAVGTPSNVVSATAPILATIRLRHAVTCSIRSPRLLGAARPTRIVIAKASITAGDFLSA